MIDTQNPFEKTGLSREAAGELASLDDDEIATVMNGIRRVIVKALHPDTGSSASNSDFMDGVITSTHAIEDMSGSDARILAKSFAKNNQRKQRARKKSAPIAERLPRDLRGELIASMAAAPLSIFGISLADNTEIYATTNNSDSKFDLAVRLFKVGPDEYKATSVDYFDLQPNGATSKEFKDLTGPSIKKYVPWGDLITAEHKRRLSSSSSKQTASTVSVTGSLVKRGGKNLLFDAQGNCIDDDFTSAEHIPFTEGEGLYRLSGSVAKGSNGYEFTEQALISNALTDEGKTETLELRAMGSVNRKFRSAIIDVVTASAKVNRKVNDNTPLLPQTAPYSRRALPSGVLGVEITNPELIDRIGEHYSSTIALNRNLLVSIAGKLQLLGNVTRILKYPSD